MTVEVNAMSAVQTTDSIRSQPLNKISVFAFVIALLSVFALWFFDLATVAIFAVGAGHVALHQLKTTPGRGALLARSALFIGYAVAAISLISFLMMLPVIIQRLTL